MNTFHVQEPWRYQYVLCGKDACLLTFQKKQLQSVFPFIYSKSKVVVSPQAILNKDYVSKRSWGCQIGDTSTDFAILFLFYERINKNSLQGEHFALAKVNALQERQSISISSYLAIYNVHWRCPQTLCFEGVQKHCKVSIYFWFDLLKKIQQTSTQKQ